VQRTVTTTVPETQHEVEVEYVPICAECGEPVEETDADDGTFQHIERRCPSSTETLEEMVERRYREHWMHYFGKAVFEARWEPERGVMAFQDQFYDGKLNKLGGLPVLVRRGDNLEVQDYNGRFMVLRPGDVLTYGLQD
jgi:hypothetical protein